MMDLDRALKEYHKLKVPKDLYDPSDAVASGAKYNVIVTERATGKTTNVLLLGLVCNWLFGTVVQYVRQYDDMLTPKNARELMDVVTSYGYVSKITRKKYNSLIYKARRWYYCNYDAEGNVTDQSNDPCMVCLSIDKHDTYKSSYNAPDGDFIIFDEFCAKRHAPDEFVSFCDLLSTIIRSRTTPVIWMLGNTIDKYEYYFDELEVSDYLRYMDIGDRELVTTSKGTSIYIEIFAVGKKKKEKSNKLYFGFKNSRLNAITGDDWLIVPCQHIDGKDDTREVLDKVHYVEYEGHYLQIEVCDSEKIGLHLCIHKANKCGYADSVVYSCEEMVDARRRYRFGHSKADRMIWTLYERKKAYYATNSDASIMDKYYSLASQL